MSWVFLTDRHAWKLKKPTRVNAHDLGTVEARRDHCHMELRLNRRLADGVYLGVLPLVLDAEAHLRLAAAGTPVDWLIHMRRLPADRMLDRVIANGTLREGELRPFIAMLAAFYRACAPAPLSPGEFRARFAAGITDNAKELRLPEAGLARRARRGRLRAAAGHARARRRPLRAPRRRGPRRRGPRRPASRARLPGTRAAGHRLPGVLPGAAHAGCGRGARLSRARMRAPRRAGLEGRDLRPVRGVLGRPPSPALVDFYQSYHAAVRAKLAVWHLLDPALHDRARWPAHASAYLRLAAGHLERRA